MRTAVPIIGRQQKPSSMFLYGQLYVIESKAVGRNISHSIEMPEWIEQTDRALSNGPPATPIGSRIVVLTSKIFIAVGFIHSSAVAFVAADRSPSPKRKTQNTRRAKSCSVRVCW